MKYIVYVHTNRNNGKRYVGWAVVKNQTAHEAMMRRWRNHCYDAKIGHICLFHNAIRKYGENSWDHEILEVMHTLNGVKRAEILWIAQYQTFAFDEGSHGYNMTLGGDGVHGYQHTSESRQKNSIAHKGLVKTAVHRERLRISNTGKKRSKETCEKIRNSKKGEKHPFFGKHLSKATCLSIRMSQPNRRRVIQITKTGEFVELHSSSADAQRKTGIPATNIIKCCKGHLKSAGKFVWHYANLEER